MVYSIPCQKEYEIIRFKGIPDLFPLAEETGICEIAKSGIFAVI